MGRGYFYTFDHLLSVRELISSTGSITSRLSYDVYGKTTVVSGTTLPTFQYGHYYNHSASGLYLTWRRAYDLNTGKWLSRDPIGIGGGFNIYAYCYDNPVSRKDPLGLDTWKVNAKSDYTSTWENGVKAGIAIEINFAADRTRQHCCKKIRFAQRANNGGSWMDDLEKPQLPDGQEPGSKPGTQPYYANQGDRTTANTTNYNETMYDNPNSSNFVGLGLGKLFRFTTCAFCLDKGDAYPERLGCIHWGFTVDGFGTIGDFYLGLDSDPSTTEPNP